MKSEQPRIPFYSVGHSTRSLPELLALLEEHAVETLVDVRRYPGSRRHPHFSRESLAASIAEAAMRYEHLEALGGHRKPLAGSPNAAWRNASFRGYADHMATGEFAAAVERLVDLPGPVAFMCAEAVPWRCHRNLLSDELTRRGCEVIHILGLLTTKLHVLNPAARDAGGFLVYGPSPEDEHGSGRLF